MCYNNVMDLKKQSALITGAGSGLGLACAHALCLRGYQVMLLDKDLTMAKSTLSAYPVIAHQVDFLDTDAVLACLQDLPEQLQVGIFCTGIAQAGLLFHPDHALDAQKLDEALRVNFTTHVLIMQKLVSHMISQKQTGVMIHTSSIASVEGQAGQIAYSASKSAICGMILPAARELARFGIRVNAIAPGVMQTPMVEKMPKKVQSSLKAQIPYPDRFGKAQEFADLALHIIDNTYLNGTVIRLDAALRMA